MQSQALGTGSFETPVLPTPDGYSPMREGDSTLPYSAALSSVLRPAQSTGASTTGHQMLRVCSPGLPALAGVLSVATLSSVRPRSAHMHSRRVLGSNGLHTGNVRETAVATAVSTMAARCSRGFAGPGTWAPELAKDALRCIPSRSSLPEALVVLGDIRRWLPWSYERDTQETLLGLGGFGNEPARRRRSCRPSERAPALGTGAV